MDDRFKFRVPFYRCDDTFAGFQYTDAIRGLNVYNAGKAHHIDFEQCTGIEDKNGNLIFEGDIIKMASLLVGFPQKYEENIAVVKWIEIGFCFEFPKLHDGIGWEECVEYEIIGNIHETPELLEAKG